LIERPNPFERVKDTLLFVSIALVMCLVGSAWGVASLCIGGYLQWSSAFERWLTWWIGDTGGVLVMAPVILTCRYLGWPRWDRERWREAMLLFGAVMLFAVAIFVWLPPGGENKYPADL